MVDLQHASCVGPQHTAAGMGLERRSAISGPHLHKLHDTIQLSVF